MNTHFYDNFLEALTERYPRKTDLVNALMDILTLEKESIYRRLRKDVLFTSEEMMKIASAWHISLDNVISVNPHKIRPFSFNMIEFFNPQEADYEMFEDYNRILELVSRDPDGRLIVVTNTLPGALYYRYDNLTRFYMMKWLYKYNMPENHFVLNDIHIPERMRRLEKECIEHTRNVSAIHAIHDRRFIEHLIGDIRYFRSIGMVTEDVVALLKDELLDMIDYMKEVAIKGYYPDTGNKLFFYLSHTNLETEYFLFESKYITRVLVKILERNTVTSSDKIVFQKFLHMVQSTMRSSVLLSGSNSLQVMEFYAKHRDLILALK